MLSFNNWMSQLTDEEFEWEIKINGNIENAYVIYTIRYLREIRESNES